MTKTKKRPTRKASPKTPSPEFVPNSELLKRLLENKDISYNDVARRLHVQKAMVSRVIHGYRKLQIHEVDVFAELLGLHNLEVLELFGHDSSGYRAALGAKRPGEALVEGRIDGALSVHLEGLEPAQKSKKPVAIPFAGVEKAFALICQTTGSEFTALDGSIIFYEHSLANPTTVKSSKLKSPQLDMWALVKIANQPGWRFRVVKRGYNGVGKYNLTSLDGRIFEESVQIEALVPVIGMQK